jgi:hypothetical protein
MNIQKMLKSMKIGGEKRVHAYMVEKADVNALFMDFIKSRGMSLDKAMKIAFNESKDLHGPAQKMEEALAQYQKDYAAKVAEFQQKIAEEKKKSETTRMKTFTQAADVLVKDNSGFFKGLETYINNSDLQDAEKTELKGKATKEALAKFIESNFDAFAKKIEEGRAAKKAEKEKTAAEAAAASAAKKAEKQKAKEAAKAEPAPKAKVKK